MLDVSRQAFNNYLKTKDRPWKYQSLADAMLEICKEDECNDMVLMQEVIDYNDCSDVDVMVLVNMSDEEIRVIKNEIYDIAFDIQLSTA